MLLARSEQTLGEAGLVKRRPEPVPRSGEVVPGGRGVEPGIDTAEEQIEAESDHIRDSSADRGCEVEPLQNLTRPLSMSRNITKSPARL